jgi:NitT/TauT family transport system substrate-binding protein
VFAIGPGADNFSQQEKRVKLMNERPRMTGGSGRSSRPYTPARRLFAVAAAAATVSAAVLSAAACSSSSSSQSTTSQASHPASASIVVAAVPATGAAGLYIAEQRGLFAAAGLHVTIKSSVSAADVIPDLINGSVNVSLGQWTSAIAVAARGIGLRALGPGNAGGPGLEQVVVAAHSPVTTLAQLKGKTIAVNALSGLSQLLTDSALAKAGVAAAQVHYTVIPFPDMAAALAAHRVDAALMIQPYLAKAGHQVTELADIDQGATQDFPITGYIATAAWVKKNPSVAASFIRALNQGQKLAASDRSAVNKAVVQYVGVSQQAAASMTLGAFPPSVKTADLNRVATMMQSYGLLPKSVNVSTVAAGMTS